MPLHILVLIGALYAIIKASDLFIDLAGSLGKRLSLKEYFIGSLIVGIGTSLPELFTSLAAVFQDSSELVIPTVFGTVIANLGAGFGLGVLVLFVWVPTDAGRMFITRRHAYAGGTLNISPDRSDKHHRWPIILAALSVILSLLLCMDGEVGRTDAGIFFLGYSGFFFWELRRGNLGGPTESDDEVPPQMAIGTPWPHALRILAAPVGAVAFFAFAAVRYRLQDDHLVGGLTWDMVFLAGLVAITLLYAYLFAKWRESGDSTGRRLGFSDFSAYEFRRQSTIVILLFLAISIGLVYLSGVVTVKVLLALSKDLDVGSTVLAASALAIGTSLPDIVVALNVARRGLHRMLAGHILQSNIFDVFLIVGLCGLIRPLPETFTGAAQLSLVFAVLMTLPLLFAIRTRRINFKAALALVAGMLLFLGLVVSQG